MGPKKKGSPRDTIYRLKTPKAKNNQPSATVFPQGSLQSAFPAGKSKHHCLLFKQAANKQLASAVSQLAPWLPSSQEKKARPAHPTAAPSYHSPSDLKAGARYNTASPTMSVTHPPNRPSTTHSQTQYGKMQTLPPKNKHDSLLSG